MASLKIDEVEQEPSEEQSPLLERRSDEKEVAEDEEIEGEGEAWYIHHMICGIRRVRVPFLI